MPTHPDVPVPTNELVFRATRAGGPGGQHVNTSSTRVELWWDVASSPSITDEQRTRLLAKLGNRIDSAGLLRLVSSGSRSQLQNRRDVTDRFHRMVAQALHVPRKRKKTRPTKAAKERRLESKKRQGNKKALRRKPADD